MKKIFLLGLLALTGFGIGSGIQEIRIRKLKKQIDIPVEVQLKR